MSAHVRPHNRFKLPYFVVCAVLGLVLAADGIVAGSGWRIAVGVAVTAAIVHPIVLIRGGVNPWWLRAPIDPKPPPSGEDPR